VFIMGHEIVHNVYGDVEFSSAATLPAPCRWTTAPRCRSATRPMQKAMDFRINALLGQQHRLAAEGLLLDDTIAKANDGVCDVYRKVYEDEENGGSKTGKHRGFDIVLKPGQQRHGQQPRNPQQWGVEIAAAQVLESMKSQGKMAGALKRMFEEMLNPVVPWTDHIRGIFNRKVGSGSYNWKRPDRRFIVRDIHAVPLWQRRRLDRVLG
jgi:hypothetical protein